MKILAALLLCLTFTLAGDGLEASHPAFRTKCTHGCASKYCKKSACGDKCKESPCRGCWKR